MCRLLLVAALVGWAATARGQQPGPAAEQTALQLLDRAKALYAEGAFGEAQELLDRARAAPGAAPVRAEIWFQLGLARAADNQRPAALEAFQQALRHDPALRIDAEQYKPELVALVEEARRGLEGELAVQVRGAAQRATVWIDDDPAGPAPLRRRLLAGAHRVALRGPDGASRVERTVRVQAGAVTRVMLEVPAAAAAAPAGGTRREPREASRRGRGRLWTWVAAGAAVVAAGVAVGLGLSAIDDRDEGCWLLAEPKIPCEQRSHLQREGDRERYLALEQAVSDKRLGANVAWITAGTLAAAAAVLFWIEGRGAGRRERGARAHPRVGLGSVGLSIDY